MFIRVRRNNTPVLLALSEIALVEPFDGGKKVSIKSTSGAFYFWDCTLEQAQDALIDNAAQVTAPIASRIVGLDNTVARLCRSMEDWLEKADTPIISCDGMTPEEAERFKATMREAQVSIDYAQARLRPDGTKARLMRAEALLAEVHHAWNNDSDAASAIGHYLGSNIENFLYPSEKSPCEKE